MRVAVTTSKDDELLLERARQIAVQLEIEVVPRRRRSLEKLKNEYNLQYLLVVEQDQVVLKGETLLTWHPSMAVPRIKALRQGKHDPMIEAMALRPGSSVLDCTLGLGSDALVTAHAVGNMGRVTGLESNKYLAFITKWGLDHYNGQNASLKAAVERITVINCAYQDYLAKQPAASYDVVYFDPMFRRGLERASAMNAIRPFANDEPLSEKTVEEALRVARHRVVMKESAGSREFYRLKAHFIVGGRHSHVAYAVWKNVKVEV